ncbi:MAG: S-layer homology domain-containing protein [Oscillospiraceae bacterium]|nr:S-layer homology domain-containing protein [Oscillospiraceae bacterium]
MTNTGDQFETERDNGIPAPTSSSTANPTTSSSSSQSQQQTPTANNSGGSTGGGGGYASPIVNIDAIEVPLADGTTIVLPFLDVPQDAYYTEAVAWAYSNDITGGVADDRFDPLATCTRSQMVTFLWRAAGSPEPTGTAPGFSDVAAGSWYEKAVAWAVENKITDGVGDGRFDPNGIVNRAQAVTFLYRAKGAPETTASEGFTDVGSGEYYTDAVAWAVANGVTDGVGNNAFAPNNNCVRGQTVTFLYRAYK